MKLKDFMAAMQAIETDRKLSKEVVVDALQEALAVHGDNPVTGNGKQIRAGIADGNTGLTTVHHWHHSGGQRTVCGHHAAVKKQAAEYYCRIIFSHRLFPRNYPARSPRFPASE